MRMNKAFSIVPQEFDIFPDHLVLEGRHEAMLPVAIRGLFLVHGEVRGGK
jgi:hypothetical protein